MKNLKILSLTALTISLIACGSNNDAGITTGVNATPAPIVTPTVTPSPDPTPTATPIVTPIQTPSPTPLATVGDSDGDGIADNEDPLPNCNDQDPINVFQFTTIANLKNILPYHCVLKGALKTHNVTFDKSITDTQHKELFKYTKYIQKIDGNLIVTASVFQDLTLFKSLQEVTETISIDHNPKLSSLLGLNKVTTVGSTIVISGNAQLVNISNLFSLILKNVGHNILDENAIKVIITNNTKLEITEEMVIFWYDLLKLKINNFYIIDNAPGYAIIW